MHGLIPSVNEDALIAVDQRMFIKYNIGKCYKNIAWSLQDVVDLHKV